MVGGIRHFSLIDPTVDYLDELGRMILVQEVVDTAIAGALHSGRGVMADDESEGSAWQMAHALRLFPTGNWIRGILQDEVTDRPRQQGRGG